MQTSRFQLGLIVTLAVTGCEAVTGCDGFRACQAQVHQRTTNFTGDEIQVQEDYWEGFGTKKVLLDPGHGCGQNEVEAKSNWTVVQGLEAHLESTGHFKVYKTRASEDKGCKNSTFWRRGLLAAKKRVDVMLSIHADGPAKTQEGSWFIWTSEQQGLLSQQSEWLAVTLGAAFKHEKLPIFHFRKFLKPHEIPKKNPKDKNNQYISTQPSYGVHLTTTGLGVLKNSRRPAVLIETHFLKNPVEAQRFQDPEHLKKFHRGIELGLINFFAWRDGRLSTRDQLTEGYWTIQVKATTDKDEAEDIQEELSDKDIGDIRIETFEQTGGTWYRVRMGKYTQRQALDVALHSLQVNGWSEYWIDQVSPQEDPENP